MMDIGKPQQRPRRAWIKQVIAPLLGLSLGLHGLLLLAPLPAPKPAEESPDTEPAAEETAVDLLSISALATATPIPESSPATPPPTAPPPAAPPAPAPYPVDAPPVPLADPEAVEELVEEPPPESTDAPPPEEPTEEPPQANAMADSAPTPGFDPNRQAQLVGAAAGLGRAPDSSNFDLTDQFPGDIWDLYISRWGAAKQQCFFSAIDRESYALRAPAADLRYLSRNVQLVEQQDIPRTFAGQVVQPLDTAYCEANLFEVQDNGVPILWVSLVPVSPGGSTTLVVFWQADPRL